jgi:TolA-binding protein
LSAPARRGFALLLLALPASVSSQTPEEQARRLLEDGRAYRKQGKHKQALDSFNTVVSGFSNTGSVDDALLELGRYQAEIDGDAEKARRSFEEIAKRFPQSDSAPGAYYQLGALAMSRGGAAELDDALAHFNRVERLYSRSEWVPRAIHASGLVHRKAGRLAEAIEAQRRVSMEYPTSEAAAAAQFQIGHCLALLGEARQAMEEYQHVRNRFPDSEWAARALERITALYRFSESGRPVFALDATYSVGAGEVLKDVRALSMTPARTLWIASDKLKSVVPFDVDGKPGPGISGDEIRTLCLSPAGELVVASKTAVRVGSKDVKTFTSPGDKPGSSEPLEKITAALVTEDGHLLVADDRRRRVHRYDAKLEYKGPFPDAKEREVSRMTLDTEGGIVLLDRDEKTVRVFDAAGRLLRSVGPRGPGFELKKPADVAVDASRNTYVADEESGVYIFSADGRLLGTLSGEELKRPKALALDPAGALLVYDDRAQRVLRYR